MVGLPELLASWSFHAVTSAFTQEFFSQWSSWHWSRDWLLYRDVQTGM